MDSWDRRIKLEAKRFISGWDWDLVYHTWSRRFHDFNVNLTPLFKEIRVYDPNIPLVRRKFFHGAQWILLLNIILIFNVILNVIRVLLGQHITGFKGNLKP
nr:hypothetical protein [Syntrophomonas wolfei]